MKIVLRQALLIFAMLPFWSHAEIGVTRSLQTVFDESSIVVFGVVIQSELGPCDGEGRQSVYTMRVSQTLKGSAPKEREIKLCGPARILLSEEYIVAGRLIESGEVVFSADAVIMFRMPHGYYRLISYDSPYVTSDRGKVFGVGIEEPDFLDRFGKLLGLKPPAAAHAEK